MNYKYRLLAAALAMLMLSGCAGGESSPISSGDLPPTTTPPAVTEPENSAPVSEPVPSEDDPDITSIPESFETETSENEISEPEEDPGYQVVDIFTTMYSTDILNVRELPSTESQVVGQLNLGDKAEVTGMTSNGWYRINYNGGTAFVYGEYLSTERPEIPEEEIVIPENYYFASADDYFFVVNKDVFLPEDYQIETDFVQGSYELEIVAAYHCKQMIEAAQKDGVELKVLSAYRTVEYQQNLFDRNVQSRMNDDGMSYVDAYNDVSINIAPPGGSEHNAGLAVDIIDYNHWDTYEAFEDTKEFAWLSEHCTEYGFILRYPKGKESITGYIYEPWHYRYVGTKYAAAVMNSDLCLEEYFEQNGY